MICRLQERGSHSQTGMGEGPRRAHSASKERHWAGGRHTGACSLYILVCVYVRVYIPLQEIILKPGRAVTSEGDYTEHFMTNGVPGGDLDPIVHHSAVMAALDWVLLHSGDSCPAQTVPTPVQGLNTCWLKGWPALLEELGTLKIWGISGQ